MARSAFRFSPLTLDNFADLETLFGPRGACGGCWCMTWRLPRAAYDAGKGDGNREALRSLAASGQPVGVLAYDGIRPAGWISVAPREQYHYLARTRTLQPPDDKPVWSATCFFIHKDYRRRGLSNALLDAAEKWVASQGGTILEGYPSVPRTAELPPAFAWTGLPVIFERAGFAECPSAGRGRKLMRKALPKPKRLR
ncbi:MAG: GNAT family N-acetyltransferase [Bryobacteraceae bacterium]